VEMLEDRIALEEDATTAGGCACCPPLPIVVDDNRWMGCACGSLSFRRRKRSSQKKNVLILPSRNFATKI
jgi:hypothetical protein